MSIEPRDGVGYAACAWVPESATLEIEQGSAAGENRYKKSVIGRATSGLLCTTNRWKPLTVVIRLKTRPMTPNFYI
jgi:hypothetical protein